MSDYINYYSVCTSDKWCWLSFMEPKTWRKKYKELMNLVEQTKQAPKTFKYVYER